MLHRNFAVVLLYVSAGWSRAQTPLPSRPSFDVVSIKVNSNDEKTASLPSRSGDRIIMHNTTLASIVFYAYKIEPTYQLSRADGQRLRNDPVWYDIEALTSGAADDGQLRLMFQTLLEQRFQLKVHREMRDAPVYDLVLAKPGKLQPTRPDVKIGYFGNSLPAGEAGASENGKADGMHLLGKAAPMERLADALKGQLHAPVRNLTGLSGLYDFDVRFENKNGGLSAALSPDAPLPPSLERALLDELGLKLVKSIGTVEFLVIDKFGKLIPD